MLLECITETETQMRENRPDMDTHMVIGKPESVFPEPVHPTPSYTISRDDGEIPVSGLGKIYFSLNTHKVRRIVGRFLPFEIAALKVQIIARLHRNTGTRAKVKGQRAFGR